MAESVILNVPQPLYDRLKRRAEQMHRTVEAELLEAAATVVADDQLPTQLITELEAMALLDDAALWQAARTRFPTHLARVLERLIRKRKNEGISPIEEERVTQLLAMQSRIMLVRAQAAVLLKDRGHDISVLLTDA